jgi:hypothetical protein
MSTDIKKGTVVELQLCERMTRLHHSSFDDLEANALKLASHAMLREVRRDEDELSTSLSGLYTEAQAGRGLLVVFIYNEEQY